MSRIYLPFSFVGSALLTLFFRKWFDIVLWPRLADWWASWSQKRLQRKILLLEYELKSPIRAEEIIIFGLMGIFEFLVFLVFFLLCWLTPTSLSDLKISVWTRVVSVVLLWVVGQAYSIRLARKFMQW